MSDSNMDSLLEQMSLKAPSAALDQRVEDAMCVTSPINGVRSWSTGWKMLTTVAVACLMIGGAVGRMTMPRPTKQYSVGFAPVNDLNWNPVGASAQRDSQAFSGRQPPVGIPASFQGPQVAMFCSAPANDVSATQEERCSKCHMGAVKDQQSPHNLSNGVGHVQHVHRQLCAKCHVSSKDWQPHEIDSAIFGEPRDYHNPPSDKKMPTG